MGMCGIREIRELLGADFRAWRPIQPPEPHVAADSDDPKFDRIGNEVWGQAF